MQDLCLKADQMLNSAMAEMNRAHEDVVTHLICGNARNSIIHYLSAFLISKGASLPEEGSIAVLQNKCAEIDPRFGALDFSPIQCRFEQNEEYCLDLKEVEICFKLARKTGELVKEE